MILFIFAISGKRPVSMLMDDEWDLKSHPYLDPKGENNLNAERKVRKIQPTQRQFPSCLLS